MANLVLFEVEIGGRSIVIGGFSTHGWVRQLSTDEQDRDSLESEQYPENVIQGSNGSFVFNLTDNLRFDEVSKITLVDYFTKAH